MLFKSIRPWTTDLLRAGMQQTSLRHRTITHNIANVDTPGYQRKDVRFADFLKTAQMIQNSRAFGSKSIPIERLAWVEVDDRPALRQDGNNVSIDEEMALMAENSGRYKAFLEIHERQIRMLKSAISENIV